MIFRELQTYRPKDSLLDIKDYEVIWIKKWIPVIIKYFFDNFGIKDFYVSTAFEVRKTWPDMSLESEIENYQKPFEKWDEAKEYQCMHGYSRVRQLRKCPAGLLELYVNMADTTRKPLWIGDFFPAEKKIINNPNQRTRVYFSIRFDAPFDKPGKQLRASIWCGDPTAVRTIQKRDGKIYDVPNKWREIPMKIINDFGDGCYRFSGLLPKGFQGEYTFKFSFDGGQTWGWVGEPWDNFKVQKSGGLESSMLTAVIQQPSHLASNGGVGKLVILIGRGMAIMKDNRLWKAAESYPQWLRWLLLAPGIGYVVAVLIVIKAFWPRSHSAAGRLDTQTIRRNPAWNSI